MSAFLISLAVIFVAELGDKTMLATVTLAAGRGGLPALAGVWAGSTIGMVAADALAIAAGQMLGRNLPERVVKYGAAAGFALFGAILLVEGITA